MGTKRLKPVGPHPVEIAVANAAWAKLMDTAELQLYGSWEGTKILETTMSLLYVVGLAAHRSGVQAPELRIIAGSCRTALDCISTGRITGQQRETLGSGLAAARRLKPLVKGPHFVAASIEASLLIRSRGVNWSDFQEFTDPAPKP